MDQRCELHLQIWISTVCLASCEPPSYLFVELTIRGVRLDCVLSRSLVGPDVNIFEQRDPTQASRTREHAIQQAHRHHWFKRRLDIDFGQVTPWLGLQQHLQDQDDPTWITNRVRDADSSAPEHTTVPCASHQCARESKVSNLHAQTDRDRTFLNFVSLSLEMTGYW